MFKRYLLIGCGYIKCTVVIPALNEEASIVSCIHAVKKQASDTEILVVDGGSTDHTIKFAKDAGARVVVEKIKTVSAGRHTGLQQASGDIVCYIDADCIPQKGWFDALVSPFSNPKVMGVGGCVLPINGTLVEEGGLRLVFSILAPLFFWFQTPLISGQNMAFRRTEALKVGGFPHKLIHGEDTIMFLRIKTLGKIVHSRSTVLADMRRVRKWGLMKYLRFNIQNFVSLLKYQQPISEKYEAVRQDSSSHHK